VRLMQQCRGLINIWVLNGSLELIRGRGPEYFLYWRKKATCKTLVTFIYFFLDNMKAVWLMKLLILLHTSCLCQTFSFVSNAKVIINDIFLICNDTQVFSHGEAFRDLCHLKVCCAKKDLFQTDDKNKNLSALKIYFPPQNLAIWLRGLMAH